MGSEEPKKNSKEDVFKRKHKSVNYNPIRPIKYPDHTTSLLGDTAVTSNIIGEDNGKILGLFCYDYDEDER